jgi:hypothetical protein
LDSVQLGGILLFVFGKDDVDLGVCRHGNDDPTVSVQIHDFGVTSRPDVFGYSLSQYVLFRERRAAVGADYLSEE